MPALVRDPLPSREVTHVSRWSRPRPAATATNARQPSLPIDCRNRRFPARTRYSLIARSSIPRQRHQCCPRRRLRAGGALVVASPKREPGSSCRGPLRRADSRHLCRQALGTPCAGRPLMCGPARAYADGHLSRPTWQDQRRGLLPGELGSAGAGSVGAERERVAVAGSGRAGLGLRAEAASSDGAVLIEAPSLGWGRSGMRHSSNGCESLSRSCLGTIGRPTPQQVTRAGTRSCRAAGRASTGITAASEVRSLVSEPRSMLTFEGRPADRRARPRHAATTRAG